jgi:hypothetical protein
MLVVTLLTMFRIYFYILLKFVNIIFDLFKTTRVLMSTSQKHFLVSMDTTKYVYVNVVLWVEGSIFFFLYRCTLYAVYKSLLIIRLEDVMVIRFCPPLYAFVRHLSRTTARVWFGSHASAACLSRRDLRQSPLRAPLRPGRTWSSSSQLSAQKNRFLAPLFVDFHRYSPTNAAGRPSSSAQGDGS